MSLFTKLAARAAKYSKFWVAGAGVGAVVLQAYADGKVTADERTNIVIAVGTALTVLLVPNKKPAAPPPAS